MKIYKVLILLILCSFYGQTSFAQNSDSASNKMQKRQDSLYQVAQKRKQDSVNQIKKTKEDAILANAKAFIDLMQNGDYEAARKYMIDPLRTKFHPVALKNYWTSMEKDAGVLHSLGTPKFGDSAQFSTLTFPAEFSKKGVGINFTYTPDMKISAVYFKTISIIKAITSKEKDTTASHKEEGPLPTYARLGGFLQKDVEINANNRQIPGTLTLPTKGSNWPVVVLVQTYGPFDRDETIGPNKPFRDIAIGLAAQGIASFRYDKRTYVYKNEFENGGSPINVNNETIEDVITAINYVRNLDYLDKKQVYILGHGMGAYLAPKIGKHAPFLAGLIMIAAPGLPLDESILSGERILLVRQDDTDSSSKVDALEEKIKLVKQNQDLSKYSADQLPGDLPGTYWADIKNYSSTYTAYDLKMPLFIIRGSRDYKMTNEDMDRWKTVLRKKLHVKFKNYPFNHFMMEGLTDIGLPNEYEKPSFVPLYLMTDIAQWIKNNRP